MQPSQQFSLSLAMHSVETCLDVTCQHPRCVLAVRLHQYVQVCELLDPRETEKRLPSNKQARYIRGRDFLARHLWPTPHHGHASGALEAARVPAPQCGQAGAVP